MGDADILEITDFKKRTWKKRGQANAKPSSSKSQSKTISKPPLKANSKLDRLAYFSELIDQTMVMVVVDTFVDGVKVPPAFEGAEALPINWSKAFGLHDFVYDEEGVRGTLSFDQEPFFVFIPWNAVRAIADAKNPHTYERWDTEHVKNEKTSPIVGASIKTRVREGLLGFAKKLLK